jgi:hypothetical protein
MSKSTTKAPEFSIEDKVAALARLMGETRGEAAASWVFDGNTTPETYAKVLDGIQSGDPALDDLVTAPNWLSGEFADGATPASLQADLALSDEVWEQAGSAVCDAYESAANDAFWDHVTKAAMDATA